MMMTPNDVLHEINNLVRLLAEYGLTLDANRAVRVRSGGLDHVGWPSTSSPSPDLLPESFATIGDYCAILKNRSYTALLFDGAILQLHYAFKGGAMLQHRLCYYPCPYDVKQADLATDPALDVIERYQAQGGEFLRLRSPLRFDYDARGARPGHPTCHVHVLAPDCRCPVVAPISTGHFVRFVFRHFYPGEWETCGFLREWPQRLGARTIRPDEEGMLHFACARPT
jgi:hypothetical protein